MITLTDLLLIAIIILLAAQLMQDSSRAVLYNRRIQRAIRWIINVPRRLWEKYR